MIEVKLPVETRKNVSLASGRIVWFTEERPTNCVDVEDVADWFEIVGPCNEDTKEYSVPKPRKKCGSCGGGKKQPKVSEMRCDFQDGVCIRCGVKKPARVNYRTCERIGLGDKIAWLTTLLRIPYCKACDRRRARLNEWDRSLFRRYWRMRHGIPKNQ